MKFLKSKSLSKRFSLTTILVVSLIVVIFCIIAITLSTLKINDELKQRVKNVSRIATVTLSSALWNLEKDTISDLAEALFQEEEVVYFRLVDSTGVLYEKKKPEYNKESFAFFQESSQFITGDSDIFYKGDKIGAIELAISKKSYRRELLLNILSIIGLTMVIIIAISVTSIFIMKRHIFRPLKKLEESATVIAQKNLDAEIDTTSQDEIGTLAKSFDEMRQSLKNMFAGLDQKVEERTADLHKSEQKLKTILDNLTRRVYWKNINGVIEGGNRILANDLGLSEPKKLEGKTEWDIWKKQEVVQFFRELTEKVIEGKKGEIDITRTIVNENGEQRWFKINCSPLLDEGNNVVSILVTYRDITTEVQYEDKLKKARARAEKANKAKDQFLANISHEIRTPMNSIMGFIEQVLQTRLNLKQRNYLNIVNSSSRDLLRIINDILDFSKIESGQIKINHSEFHLRNVLDDVINNFYNEAAEKDIELVLVREKGVPETLVGDEGRLKQVLKNLVGNAIQFTGKGKVSLRVLCTDKKDDKASIHFSVKDTGIGISNQDKAKIFLPYQQLRETTRGVGLGLTISRQLVALMGGEINVKSELGQGSSFYLSISFETKGFDSQEVTDEPLKLDFTDLQGLKVLVVEDDKGSRLLMQTILSNHRIKVECAENGKQAIEKVGRTSYDVVLMDMQLPILSGYEAIKIIRQELQLSRLPIIAVTASAIVGDQQECLAAGADDYISKPISADDLLLTIKKWIIRMRESLIKNELAGIDVKGALKRLKVDIDIFKQSLADFLESYGSTMEKIKDALFKQDREKARKLLHTLRGSAVNIGANDVESSAKKLGEAIVSEKEDLQSLINNLETSLITVLDSIQSVV